MKKSFIIACTVLLLSLTGCNSDDDLPQSTISAASFNQFCFGPNPTDAILVSNAFNTDPVITGASTYTTNVTVTDDNFTVDMGAISGAGSIVTFELIGNRDFAIQSGLYTIGTDPEPGNVRVTYSTDFDTSNTLNTGTSIISGLVRVTPARTGYLIEVDGEDASGTRFHGNYLGNLTPLN